MKRVKLTVEQFREFKTRLLDLATQAEKFYEENKNDVAKTTIFMDETKKKYIQIQSELFSYDLSLVSFEEWNGLEIMGVANLSGTNANIDFAIVSYHGLGMFHGCNVKNLERINRWISEEDFDERTIKNNPNIFLSDKFDYEFRKKYYNHILDFEDISKLSNEQWEELVKRNFKEHLRINYWEARLLDMLGFEKLKVLYNYSENDYKLLLETLEYGSMYVGDLYEYEKSPMVDELKKIDADKIRSWCFKYLRNSLFSDSYRQIDIDLLPSDFVENNKKELLIDDVIPEELRERFYSRNLKINDVFDNINLFEDIDVEFFIGEKNYTVLDIARTVGEGNFKKLVKKFPKELKYFIEKDLSYNFNKYYQEKGTLEESFLTAVKEYIVGAIAENNYDDELEKMNFKFIREISTIDDLMNCDSRTVIMYNDTQRQLINTLGLDLIKKFETETSFFSYKSIYTNDLVLFNSLAVFLQTNQVSKKRIETAIKNINYDVERYDEILAVCLEEMRANNIFTDLLSYDWMDNKFKEKHPEIFISEEAPDELKLAFYRNRITPEFIYQHKEYIPYLLDKNLSKTINANIQLSLPSVLDEFGFMVPMVENFIGKYSEIYGNKKTLELIAKYGDSINDIVIENVHGEIHDEKTFEKNIRKKIYQKIIKYEDNYNNLLEIPEFVEEYPDLFINLDNISEMSQNDKDYYTKKFYDGLLDFDDIRKVPQLKDALKDKNLLVTFRKVNKNAVFVRRHNLIQRLLTKIGNEKFLDLCSIYGNYLLYIENSNEFKNILYNNQIGFNELKQEIERIIASLCMDGEIFYTENAPEFLKNDYPSLFLDDDAPNELKKYFYNFNINYEMIFEILGQHKEWLPYLENKSIITLILRNLVKSSPIRQSWKKYFELFGNEKAVKLGISRMETVIRMIEARQVELMKQWYDKTGGKFIPDFVVMQNINIEDADKFLVSGNNWSTLMRFKNYSMMTETRDAMLKLAYSFGAFDQDKRGFNQLLELLVGVPRRIDEEFGYVIERIDKDINLHSLRHVFFKNIEDKDMAYNAMMNHIKNKSFTFIIDQNTLVELFGAIKKEIPDFDFSRDIFSQLYRKNEDDSYTLTINQQNCPNTAKLIRNVLERFRELPLLTPDKAHQLCGGFDLKYDPEFREFFLNNLTEIVNNYEYTTYLSRIQKQFQEIKIANSNRTLTLELAKSFVQSNRYEFVNIGNEKLSEFSAIAGYDQDTFNKLQEIYNYGKQRTFSSIPRVTKTVGKYTYEMLRLDDPLALAIGTLTDCCQELGNVAEMCMEHSMVDKNGRVFIIKDDEGNIISQSWVWRNRDVLCFDNIEIPDKVLTKISRKESTEERKKYTDEIYNLYEMAANDLIEVDEKKYKQLLEQGRITKEQYEQLRLRKVTVGLGYNDIAETLKRKASFDSETLSRPLPFEPLVKLSRGLYINDSNSQYVIAKRDNQVENTLDDTLNIYSDSYTEYTDNDFTNKLLTLLQKLEVITNDNDTDKTFIYENDFDDKKIVSNLASQYGFLPDETRIIINSNMAIVYEVRDNKIILGDLFFNTKVDNGEQQLDIETAVILQIWLALEQIKGNKELDISLLNAKQKDMYNKIVNFIKEMNLESGVHNGRNR